MDIQELIANNWIFQVPIFASNDTEIFLLQRNERVCNQDCISHLNYLLFYVNIIKGFQFDEQSVNGNRGYTFHTMEINDHDFQIFDELDVVIIDIYRVFPMVRLFFF